METDLFATTTLNAKSEFRGPRKSEAAAMHHGK